MSADRARPPYLETNVIALRKEPLTVTEPASETAKDVEYGRPKDAPIHRNYPEWWTDLDTKAVDTARLLAADAVQKAGNGHPGAEGIFESVTHRVAFTVNHAKEILMAQGLSTSLGDEMEIGGGLG